MSTIVLHSRSGADSKLHLEVPGIDRTPNLKSSSRFARRLRKAKAGRRVTLTCSGLSTTRR